MLNKVGGVTMAIQYHVPLTFVMKIMILMANQLTGNLPVNGIG